MTFDQATSAIRTAVATAGGIAVGLGISQIGNVPVSEISSAFDHIFNGLKELWIGGGTLVSVGIGLWGAYKARPWAKIASVAAMPEIKAVLVKPTAPATSAASLAASDPALPKVTKAA